MNFPTYKPTVILKMLVTLLIPFRLIYAQNTVPTSQEYAFTEFY